MNKILRRSGRRSQRGYTLISTAISFTIAGICIAGAWIAYSGMQVQWKVGNADRIMDQYAHSAMQELTNVLSWSWGGEQITGGRTPRWKFRMDDIISEHGQMDRGWTYRRDLDKMIFLSHSPRRGILINDNEPRWAQDIRGTNWFQWSGSRPGVNEINVVDQRDRITLEAVTYEFNPFARYGRPRDATSRVKQEGVLEVHMTFHYRYSGGAWRGRGTRLYGDSYVREREFETQIAMRNWDVVSNPYRDERIQSVGG